MNESTRLEVSKAHARILASIEEHERKIERWRAQLAGAEADLVEMRKYLAEIDDDLTFYDDGNLDLTESETDQ